MPVVTSCAHVLAFARRPQTTLGTLLNKYTDAKYDLTTIVDDKEVSKPSLIDAVFEHCWSENVHFKKMEDGSVSDPLPFTKMAVGAKS